jgi:hypothetical protein
MDEVPRRLCAVGWMDTEIPVHEPDRRRRDRGGDRGVHAAGYWDVSVSAANSLVAAGVWRLIGWVSNVAGERHVIFDEEMTILADATTVSPTGLLTPNERILIAIAARLEGRVTADQEQVQINGTAITRIPIEKLSALRGIYEGKVWREQNQTRSYPVHKMRFTRAR